MPRKTSKKVQTCSLCTRTGHNRRRCTDKKIPESSFGVLSSKKKRLSKIGFVGKNNVFTKSTRTLSKKILPAHIVVQMGQKGSVSQYVVNLKSAKKENPLDTVVVFSEHTVVPRNRHVVDFAALVREANAKKRNLAGVSITRKKQRTAHTLFRIFRMPVKTRKSHPSQKNTFPRVVVFRDFGKQWEVVRSMFHVRKALPLTLLLILVFLLPFPAIGFYQQLRTDSGRVMQASTDGFLALQSSTVAAFSSNMADAEQNLNLALSSFADAQTIVEQEYGVLVYVSSLIPIVGRQVSSRQRLLSAGQHLALANTYLVKGVAEAQAGDATAFTNRMQILRDHLQQSIPQYDAALVDLSHVDVSVVPSEYQQSLEDFKVLFATFIDDMHDTVGLIDTLSTVFGHDDFRRYLVVFQNNREIRPTGGFMGSFAVVDIQKGKILNIDVPGGGTYDVAGQLSAYIEPPVPLQLVNARWEFQDANWFPDFPASAKKMSWFYSKSRDTSIDGVIALNASVIERLLRVIGPVQEDSFGLLLDADNVLDALQYQVEVAYDKSENKPKAVIGDLLEQILNTTQHLDKVDSVRLLGELHEALQQKEIQVYVADALAEKRIQEFGWGGDVTPIAEGQDYVMVVNTNLQGGKSDTDISQAILHDAQVQDDGSVIVTTQVKRTHTGVSGDIFSGLPNINYLRLYVPEGSELLDAGGFSYPPESSFHVPESWYEEDHDLRKNEREMGVHLKTGTHVTSEYGKTAFGNWMMTAPGESVDVYFVYRLPYRVFVPPSQDIASSAKAWADWATSLVSTRNSMVSHYTLIAQKQSGVDSSFSSRVSYPTGWESRWVSGDHVQSTMNGYSAHRTFNTDMVFGVALEYTPS